MALKPEELQSLKKIGDIMFEKFKSQSLCELDDYDVYLHLVQSEFYSDAKKAHERLIRGYEILIGESSDNDEKFTHS